MVVTFATYEMVDWLFKTHSVLNFDCGEYEAIEYPTKEPTNSNILSSFERVLE